MKNLSNYSELIINALTRTIRPLFGIAGTCRYTVTCSAYTRYAFKTYPWHTALAKSLKRLLSCNVLIRF